MTTTYREYRVVRGVHRIIDAHGERLTVKPGDTVALKPEAAAWRKDVLGPQLEPVGEETAVAAPAPAAPAEPASPPEPDDEADLADVPSYDVTLLEGNVGKTHKAIDKIDDLAHLKALFDAETAGKERKTVLEYLLERRAKLEKGGES